MSELAWLPCQCLDGIDLEDEEVFVNAACQDCQGTGLHFPQLTEPCPGYNAVSHFQQDSGLTLAALQAKQIFCREGNDACNGSGRILAVTVEKLLEIVCAKDGVSVELFKLYLGWAVHLKGMRYDDSTDEFLGDTLMEALESAILAVVYASKS